MAKESLNHNIAALNMDEAQKTLSVHWSAVFAGVFVSFLVYFILMSLGLAVGVGTVKSVIQGDDTLKAMSAGAGLWTVISVLVSLFIGSYAAGRVSGIIATRVGYTQGAVVTSLFFIAMLSQIGFTVGMLGRGLGSITAGALNGAGEAAQSEQVTAVVEDVIGDLNFRVPSHEAVVGMIARMVRGDNESAKNYLSAQTGISRLQAQQRIDAMSAKFKSTMATVGQKSADAISLVAWSAFLTFVLGTITAMLGGATGAVVNLRKPFDRVDKALQRPAYT